MLYATKSTYITTSTINTVMTQITTTVSLYALVKKKKINIKDRQAQSVERQSKDV